MLSSRDCHSAKGEKEAQAGEARKGLLEDF
jgi:hypothetical protein